VLTLSNEKTLFLDKKYW